MSRDMPRVERCGCCGMRSRRPSTYEPGKPVLWCKELRREVRRDDGCTFGFAEPDAEEGGAVEG